MSESQPLSILRERRWPGIPSLPGVYWWYFPREELDHLGVSKLCDMRQLRLRAALDGKVCLYHGMANDLAQRVKWHAAQSLTLGCLQSGFLSTFRFTLLALNDIDYLSGAAEIDAYFDSLSVSWRVASSRDEAKRLENGELHGGYDYPLNIQGNKRPELAAFTHHLKSIRSAYKRRFVMSVTRPT